MDNPQREIDQLPAQMAEEFADLLVVRKAALALDAYIRHPRREEALVSLREAGMSEEQAAGMLRELDSRCANG